MEAGKKCFVKMLSVFGLSVELTMNDGATYGDSKFKRDSRSDYTTVIR